MSLGEQIRRNTAWVALGGVLRRFGAFLVGIVLARLLVPEDFGLLVTVQVFTGVASYLASGGMSEALVRSEQASARDFHVVFTVQLATGVLIYALFFAAAPWFAAWYDQPIYADLFKVSALGFVLRPFVNVPRTRLKRDMRFKAISTLGLVCQVFGSGSSIIMAWLGYGVWSLVVGGLIGSAVNALLFARATRWTPRLAYDPGITRRLGSYGIKTTLVNIILHFRDQTANFIIGRQFGAASLGLYNKGDSLAAMPMETLARSLYPPVFRALAKVQQDLNESQYIFLRSSALLAVYAWPLFTGLIWLAAPFVEVVYSAKWLGAVLPLQILACRGYLRTLGNLSGAVSAARNRLGREIWIQLEGLAILAIACLIGVHWGLTGVAVGVACAWAYSSLRMALFAAAVLRVRARRLVRGLLPAIGLNLGLHGWLALASFALETLRPQASPLLRLLGLGLSGTLLYGLAFLYLPIPSLATEAARWKRRLGLDHT